MRSLVVYCNYLPHGDLWLKMSCGLYFESIMRPYIYSSFDMDGYSQRGRISRLPIIPILLMIIHRKMDPRGINGLTTGEGRYLIYKWARFDELKEPSERRRPDQYLIDTGIPLRRIPRSTSLLSPPPMTRHWFLETSWRLSVAVFLASVLRWKFTLGIDVTAGEGI